MTRPKCLIRPSNLEGITKLLKEQVDWLVVVIIRKNRLDAHKLNAIYGSHGDQIR